MRKYYKDNQVYKAAEGTALEAKLVADGFLTAEEAKAAKAEQAKKAAEEAKAAKVKE